MSQEELPEVTEESTCYQVRTTRECSLSALMKLLQRHLVELHMEHKTNPLTDLSGLAESV